MVESATASPPRTRPSLLGTPAADLLFRVRGTPHSGQVIRLLAPKCTVGSGPNCTLRLQADGVSELHCLILRGQRSTVVRRIEDNTRLNGHLFDVAALNVGDQLTVGPLRLEVIDERTARELTRRVPSATILEDGQRITDSLHNVAAQARRQASQIRSALVESRRAAGRRVRHLTEQLRAARERIESLQIAATEDRERSGELQRALDEQQVALQQQLEQRQAELDSELNRRRAELDAQATQLADEQQRLAADRAAREAELEQLHQQVAQLRQQLLQQQAEAEQQLKIARQTLDTEAEKVSDSQKRLEEGRSAWERERHELEEKLRERTELLQRRQDELVENEQELERTRTELESLKAELEQLRAARAETESAVNSDDPCPVPEDRLPEDRLPEDLFADPSDTETGEAADATCPATADPTLPAATEPVFPGSSDADPEPINDLQPPPVPAVDVPSLDQILPADADEDTDAEANSDGEQLRAVAEPVAGSPAPDVDLSAFAPNLTEMMAGLSAVGSESADDPQADSPEAPPHPDPQPAAAELDQPPEAASGFSFRPSIDPAEDAGLAASPHLPESPQEDHQPTPPIPSSPPAPASAAPAGSTTRDAGEEESVEEYMARLMERLRGPSVAGEPDFDAPAPQPDLPAASDLPAAPLNLPPEASKTSTETPTLPLQPSEYRPRNQAPESKQHLGALRELANSSARSAMLRHATKTGGKTALGKALWAGGALTTAAAFLLAQPLIGSLALFGTAAALVGSVFWGAQAARSLARVLGARFQANSVPVKRSPAEDAKRSPDNPVSQAAEEKVLGSTV